ncbi:MAG TPA: sigma-70 family RNA polymerase sigma factor [Bacteroidaceae bacterium]|nr:sigma-70 family RNA polymerase sigma factor [Bacteroidaceae bacterium]
MDQRESRYRKLVKDNQLIIYKICRMFATDKATVDELFQETLINFWKGLDKFRGDSKVSSWVYRIAFNTCISYSRKRKQLREVLPITADIEQCLSDIPSDKQAMIQQMYRLIGCLEELDKAIVILYLEEKTYDEIAEITGVHRNNVGSRINRIKKKLKNMNDVTEKRRILCYH